MEIKVLPDAAALADAVAAAFLAQVSEPPPPFDDGPGIHEVALTGGSIAEQVHQAIATRAPQAACDWGTVRFWWGDERFVAADSDQRNVRQARTDLLDTLMALPEHPLPADHIMAVPAEGAVPDVEAAAGSYASLVRREGTGAFALTMLGLGPDGHIASLFPGHPGLETTEAITVAVSDSPKPPPARVSLSLEALNRSRAVWFLVSGADKAKAVARSVAAQRGEGGTLAATPAYGIGHPDHLAPGAAAPEITWWLDADSAHLLS